MRIIPDELRYILADMAADIYDMDTYNPKADAEEDDFSERVKSIKQGDTTIELATEAKVVPCANMAEVMKKYQSDYYLIEEYSGGSLWTLDLESM